MVFVGSPDQVTGDYALAAVGKVDHALLTVEVVVAIASDRHRCAAHCRRTPVIVDEMVLFFVAVVC